MNNSLNRLIHYLKNAVESDRKEIGASLLKLRNTNNIIVIKIIYFNQLIKLKEHKIDQIQDNIKSNVKHPKINKLKILKVDIMTNDDRSIIIAILTLRQI